MLVIYKSKVVTELYLLHQRMKPKIDLFLLKRTACEPYLSFIYYA